jgi:hypothetical protein
MASTGILFGPILIWSMQNSVRHIEEQSAKAQPLFFGTIPRVSLVEESVTIRREFWSSNSPVLRQQWARTLAVHQFHLNLIA